MSNAQLLTLLEYRASEYSAIRLDEYSFTTRDGDPDTMFSLCIQAQGDLTSFNFTDPHELRTFAQRLLDRAKELCEAMA